MKFMARKSKLQIGYEEQKPWISVAVAALVAAVSNTAMGIPHTGSMTYSDDESIARIPMASISIDSAQMLGRMHRRGNAIKLRLLMEHIRPGITVSRNTFGQLTGSVFPDEKVIVSGHIDSWDVGQGAQDDGGAVVMSTLVISLLKSLGLTPKRTIQAVGWTSEENGLVGVQAYIAQHREDINLGRIAAAFESDSGLFSPLGYGFSGTDKGACIVQEVLKLFQESNFTRFERGDRVGSDVSYLAGLGVPTFDFVTDNEKYFWYHHAESDTMTAMNSDELDQCLAVFAASVYVFADLSESLSGSATTVAPPPNTTTLPSNTTTTTPSPTTTTPPDTTTDPPTTTDADATTSTNAGTFAASVATLPYVVLVITVYLQNILHKLM